MNFWRQLGFITTLCFVIIISLVVVLGPPDLPTSIFTAAIVGGFPLRVILYRFIARRRLQVKNLPKADWEFYRQHLQRDVPPVLVGLYEDKEYLGNPVFKRWGCSLVVEGIDVGLDGFLEISREYSKDDWEYYKDERDETLESQISELERKVAQTVVIGHTRIGNEIFLKPGANENDAVYFWKEEEQKIARVANSTEEFAGMVRAGIEKEEELYWSERLCCAEWFFSLFLGWALAFMLLIAGESVRPIFTADENLLLLLGLLTLLGCWIAPFVLPWQVESSRMFRFPWFPLTGAMAFVLAYVLLVMTWVPDSAALIWFPALIGAIGMSVLALLRRLEKRGRFSNASLWSNAFIAVPVALVAIFRFFIWPSIASSAPYTAYSVGGSSQALRSILQTVEQGDRYEDLHERYPKIFNKPTEKVRFNFDFDAYIIEFDTSRTIVSETWVVKKGKQPQKKLPKVTY